MGMSETDIQRASIRTIEREMRKARQEGQRAARQKSFSFGSGGGAHALAASAFGKPRPFPTPWLPHPQGHGANTQQQACSGKEEDPRLGATSAAWKQA